MERQICYNLGGPSWLRLKKIGSVKFICNIHGIPGMIKKTHRDCSGGDLKVCVTAAVAQSVRALASQAEGLVFEFQPRQMFSLFL